MASRVLEPDEVRSTALHHATRDLPKPLPATSGTTLSALLGEPMAIRGKTPKTTSRDDYDQLQCSHADAPIRAV